MVDFKPKSSPSTSGTAVSVTLEEKDVEEASLEEPLDNKIVPQLQWRLLCHGIQVPSSEKKAALVGA